MEVSLVERILAQLEQAEATEANPHFQDAYRISWITVLRAARGEAEPHVSATYAVMGHHPEKTWKAIVDRRKALLGTLYGEFFGIELPPKKPMQSVRFGEHTTFEKAS